MPSSPVDPSSLSIATPTQQWQESGRLLANALDNYLEMSLLVENSHLQVIDSKDSVSRIDSSLRMLQDQQDALDKKFCQSRVAFAKTRNRLASTIYRFPEEILYEIFLRAVYNLNDSVSSTPLVWVQVRTIYLHLYNIMGVCAVWRDVCLQHPRFWSTIPMVDDRNSFWHPMLVELSFQRSGSRNFHLVMRAAHITACARKKQFLPFLNQTSRIQSLDILSHYQRDIPFIISEILRREFPKSLSWLSLHYDDDEFRPQQGIIQLEPSVLPQFTNLMGSLSGFQLSNVPFGWSYMRFSASLVQLRVDLIELRGHSTMVEFTTALSSAYELRELKLARIEAFVEEGAAFPDMPLALPKLTFLHLEDLYFSFIEWILASITPRSYYLTLNPSEFITLKMLPGPDEEEVDLKDVQRLLARYSIHKLIISYKTLAWATGQELHKLLRSMPTLKALILIDYVLDNELFKALKRPSKTQNIPFPQLETLSFRASKIPGSITGLKNLAAKHPLQGLVLGQYAFPGGSDGLVTQRARDNRIVNSLKINIPDFRFIPHDISPPESIDSPWQWSGF